MKIGAENEAVCDGCKKVMPCVREMTSDGRHGEGGPDMCHVCRREPDGDCDECEMKLASELLRKVEVSPVDPSTGANPGGVAFGITRWKADPMLGLTGYRMNRYGGWVGVPLCQSTNHAFIFRRARRWLKEGR